MNRKIILSSILIGIGFSMQASAFTCFLTLVKNSCWTNYDVTVELTNASTGDSMVKALAPKGKTYVREQFTCEAAQAFNFSATFLPIIWESEKGKHYPGKTTWSLPPEIAKGDTAWNVTMCYPEEFSGVPYPSEASGNCKCDNINLPPIPVPAKP